LRKIIWMPFKGEHNILPLLLGFDQSESQPRLGKSGKNVFA
jgi:hypothetical protein